MESQSTFAQTTGQSSLRKHCNVGDCRDEEWELIAPIMETRRKIGRPRMVDMREVWDAIQYIAMTGCQSLPGRQEKLRREGRLLPKDFPAISTVRYYFYKMRYDRIFTTINELLSVASRLVCDHDAEPTAAVIDSQSDKSTESGGASGYDVGKKIKGRKRQ